MKIKSKIDRKINYNAFNPRHQREFKYVDSTLNANGLGYPQRLSVLSSINRESQGDPLAVSDNEKWKGLLQWDSLRYVPTSDNAKEELKSQSDYLNLELQGSGWNGNDSLKTVFFNSNNLEEVNKAFVEGFIRPGDKEKETKIRYNNAVKGLTFPKVEFPAIDSNLSGAPTRYQDGGPLVYHEFDPEKEKIKEKNEIKQKAKELNLNDLLISDYNDRFPVEPVVIYKPMSIQPKEIKPQIDKTKVLTPVVEQNTSTGKVYKSSEKELFKQDMYNAYVKALKARGIKNSEAFAKRIVTQDILESNWGQSSLSKDFNFGGIKDFSEKGSQKDTVEYINGVKQTIKQSFKKFKDLDEYVNYKLDLVGRKWKVFDYNPEQYYDRLVSGTQKYATDPNYVAKLNKLYDQIW